MGVDLERIKNKLEALKNSGKKGMKGQKRTWRPEKDKTSTIRLLDYPFGPDPFVELWFHYNIGDKSYGFLCPKMNSERSCPVCELADSLKQTGQKADFESAKLLFPKQRIYAVVVDREDPTLTPKYWGFGKGVYETLLSYLRSEDYGSYLDPVNGLDVEVSYEQNNKNYPDTKLQFKRKESRLAENDKKSQEVIGNILPIEEVFKPITLAEIKDKLQKWLDGSSAEDPQNENNSRELVKGGGTPKQTTKTGVSSDKDLEGAFDNALLSAGIED